MERLKHRGETRTDCPACLALDGALWRLHGALLCVGGCGHLTAADLLRDIALLEGACASARRKAARQLTAVAAAILAAEGPEPEPTKVEADGPLVDAVEMARLLAVPVSKVRSDQRQGRIPFVPVGRYRKFDPAAVLAAYQKSA
jgi:hypothetical protein